ncbi:MAG: D-alanine--D-alanine ligase [Desulfovibrionales bacterium]
MRVLLIAGGWSEERDVSLAGAVQIRSALGTLGHDVESFDPAGSLSGLLERAQNCDFAFLNLHGAPGEDGLVQALLDCIGCPYQGSGPAGSLRALNKAASKALFRYHDIPTPPWEHLPVYPKNGWTPDLHYPLFLKPNMGGSSVGISRVQSDEELTSALVAFFEAHDDALLEEFAPGVEVTCGVLGDEALPLVLIRPRKATYFDYESKYRKGGAEETCPAPLDPSLTRTIQDLALKAHQVLGLKDYSRADFILTKQGPLLLEVNTLPGMTETSLLPQAAQAAGLNFEALIAELIRLGMAGSNSGNAG